MAFAPGDNSLGFQRSFDVSASLQCFTNFEFQNESPCFSNESSFFEKSPSCQIKSYFGHLPQGFGLRRGACAARRWISAPSAAVPAVATCAAWPAAPASGRRCSRGSRAAAAAADGRAGRCAGWVEAARPWETMVLRGGDEKSLVPKPFLREHRTLRKCPM